MQTEQAEPKWRGWLEWAVLLIIMALATYLRYWRIGEVPPGFNSDEAVGAVGALRTLREGLSYSYEGQGGGGVLGFYFAAAAFYLFGPSIATIRGLAAWASLVGLFAHYWAVRELFRGTLNLPSSPLIHSSPQPSTQEEKSPREASTQSVQSPLPTPQSEIRNPYSPLPNPQPLREASPLNRARLIAALSTLGLAVSIWHLQASRVAFAGIGVPFLLLPSIYFLWGGLNRPNRDTPIKARWPFILSGLFLGGLMYIYLSGVFAPPLYAAFFIGQWLLVRLIGKAKARQSASTPPGWFGWQLEPPVAYLTTQFWNIFATALTAILLLLPLVYVILTRSADEPGLTRVNQASFLNATINQGDPWGLLWRSIVGNFGAYGLSLSWLMGETPSRLVIPAPIGLMVFLGFLIALWRALRGQAAYLFLLLWFGLMLLPSILSPDAIPHTLRAIGATSPTYIFAAISIVSLFEGLWAIGQRWLQPHLGPQRFTGLARAVGAIIAVMLIANLWSVTTARLYQYFNIFPYTNDAKAAYHVYAVEMAEVINNDIRPEAAFILPRNTAAGDVFQNFTTDFLVELAQPPASHYWVIDDETTLAADLTQAAAQHNLVRVVKWKTSKHTGADPKAVIPYYLEKQGHYVDSESFEYFDIDTYELETPGPDFHAAETLQPLQVDFGGQLHLTGYALGDAGDANQVAAPQAHSNDLLWLRLHWQKTTGHPEDLKVSALLYADNGQLVTQVDKLLVSNILQVGSQKWAIGAQEETYFLIAIPPATPPGQYTLRLAVYEADSLTRLPIAAPESEVLGGTVSLSPVAILPAQQPVAAADLALALPTHQELIPGLTLVGFETLPGETVHSGNEVWASLLWTASDTLTADFTMSLVAKTVETDEEYALSEPVGLAGSGYPTTQWQPGEVVRGWLKARVPPTLDPGKYELELKLARANEPDGETLTLPIGQFQVEGWPRSFDPPSPQLEIGASFNEQARLVGLDANAKPVALRPGETLNLRLYWQAEAEFEQNYTAFIHVIGPDGVLYGQLDHIPGGGAYPTTGWLPSEYLTDDYAIPIAQNAPPGDYHLAIGLYQAESGQRLTLSDAACPGGACHKGDDVVKIAGLVVR